MATVVAALLLMVPFSTGSGAQSEGENPPATSSSADEPIATLEVEESTVEVRRADKDAFREARDGKSIREGDTVRTDATGRATIHYTDESFTRLDVDTSFTVVELTDDEGTRSTVGNLESGRTWNRVEDLAETETFGTEGAGATAAVTGTAYVVYCPTVDECTSTAVVHGVALSVNLNDETIDIDELEHVTVRRGVPGAIEAMTLDEFFDDSWIQDNLTIDTFLGLPGPNWLNPGILASSGQVTITGGPPIEVAGISVTRPNTPPEDPPDPPNNPPPPPTTGGNGFGAAIGSNKGGASFGGVGNCMASGAKGNGPGKPTPAC
jgi:hypothetical protein